MEINNWTIEQIKTIRNLCDISLIIIRVGKEELLPTLLEKMLEEVQGLVDEVCIIAPCPAGPVPSGGTVTEPPQNP